LGRTREEKLKTKRRSAQVAPLLGESYTILLGEVTKFVPFSPRRFQVLKKGAVWSTFDTTMTILQTGSGQKYGKLTKRPVFCSQSLTSEASGAWKLSFEGAPGELVTVTCAQVKEMPAFANSYHFM
jgi:hypothetical protein